MNIVERIEVTATIGTGNDRLVRWDKTRSSLLTLQVITNQNSTVDTLFTWAEALDLRAALDQYLKDTG